MQAYRDQKDLDFQLVLQSKYNLYCCLVMLDISLVFFLLPRSAYIIYECVGMASLCAVLQHENKTLILHSITSDCWNDSTICRTIMLKE